MRRTLVAQPYIKMDTTEDTLASEANEVIVVEDLTDSLYETVPWTYDDDEDEDDAEYDPDLVNPDTHPFITLIDKDDKPTIHVTIYEQEVSAFVDTGSRFTLINSERAIYCEKMGAEIIHGPATLRNGYDYRDLTYTTKTLTITLTVDNRTMTWTVLVDPEQNKPIRIGNDLLNKINYRLTQN